MHKLRTQGLTSAVWQRSASLQVGLDLLRVLPERAVDLLVEVRVPAGGGNDLVFVLIEGSLGFLIYLGFWGT